MNLVHACIRCNACMHVCMHASMHASMHACMYARHGCMHAICVTYLMYVWDVHASVHCMHARTHAHAMHARMYAMRMCNVCMWGVHARHMCVFNVCDAMQWHVCMRACVHVMECDVM